MLELLPLLTYFFAIFKVISFKSSPLTLFEQMEPNLILMWPLLLKIEDKGQTVRFRIYLQG